MKKRYKNKKKNITYTRCENREKNYPYKNRNCHFFHCQQSCGCIKTIEINFSFYSLFYLFIFSLGSGIKKKMKHGETLTVLVYLVTHRYMLTSDKPRIK